MRGAVDVNGAVLGSSFCETAFPASSSEEHFHGNASAGRDCHWGGLAVLGNGEMESFNLG